MGEFDADWLTIRESADAAARSVAVTDAVAEHLASRVGPGSELSILDLGSGTGANLRYLAGRLPRPQCWRLVDRDAVLLAQVLPRVSAWATGRGAIVSGTPCGTVVRGSDLDCRIEVRRVDLARLDRADLFGGRALVTASALLDLVSARWLHQLAEACGGVGAVVLFVLTYDGRWSCTPEDRSDETVRQLVNRHQHSVKGFGRALGPDATGHAARAFEAVGYEVQSASSDWRLGPTDGVLQRALIEGWSTAARQIDPSSADAIEAWRARRLAWVGEAVSQIDVGHSDLAAWRG